MKGISNFVSYTFTILFGFTILILFTSLIYSFYDQVQKTSITASLKQVSIQTTGSIVQFYNLGKEFNTNPANSTSIIISNISLNYPEKIGDKNYEVELLSSPGIWNSITNFTIDSRNVTVIKETKSSSKIIARTTQRPFITYEQDLPNIPIILQGKFRSGENDILILVRYNYNGTIEDRIILGQSDIIVGITSITEQTITTVATSTTSTTTTTTSTTSTTTTIGNECTGDSDCCPNTCSMYNAPVCIDGHCSCDIVGANCPV